MHSTTFKALRIFTTRRESFLESSPRGNPTDFSNVMRILAKLSLETLSGRPKSSQKTLVRTGRGCVAQYKYSC